MLLAACAVVAAVPAATGADRGGLTSSLETAAPARGAHASADTTIFLVRGTPAMNTIIVTGDPTGRLVISSPEGIVEPDGDKPECVQDSPTQVSCMPGFIGAIAGDLGGGSDRFSAQSTLPTLIGISLVSEERPLAGGAGNDVVSGGLGGDLITGGSGRDALAGFGGGDLVRGDAGRDTVSGGGAADNLLGGSGPDKIHGGAGRDLCNGGGGTDAAKSCSATRKIP
jgi:Ca2+-binding RTX toxin-like protein